MNTIADIDARINALTKELLLLRRRRNALSFICRLPADIMIYIFQCTQYNRISTMSFDKSIDGPLGNTFAQQRSDLDHSWIRLMSTCVYFREAALGAGQLWRDVSVPGNIQWRTLCLARAQGCLPILRYRGLPDGKADRRDEFDLASTQFSRALEAYISLMSKPDNGTTQYIYNQTSPHLQYLELTSIATALTQHLLGGDSITLKTLVLTIDAIDSCPNFPNVANLRLTWYPQFLANNLRSAYVTQINEFITWLETMPKLETLSLSWGYYDILADANLRCTAQLPSLRILSLRTPFCLGTQLLNVLPRPSFGMDIWLSASTNTRDLSAERRISAFKIAIDFWTSRNRQNHERPLVSVLHFDAGDSRSHPLLSLRSHPHDPRLNSSIPFCRLTGSDPGVTFPGMEDVRALHLVGDRVGPLNPADTDSETAVRIQELRVDLVILEEVNKDLCIKAFGKWLRQRKSEGRPVASLQIRSPATDKARASLETLVTSLLKRKVVELVDWV